MNGNDPEDLAIILETLSKMPKTWHRDMKFAMVIPPQTSPDKPIETAVTPTGWVYFRTALDPLATKRRSPAMPEVSSHRAMSALRKP